VTSVEARRAVAVNAVYSSTEQWPDAAVIGIVSATQVRITDAVVQAARPGLTPGSEVWKRTRYRLRRAFEAAGFEVLDG
jgi:hypothetical protein